MNKATYNKQSTCSMIWGYQKTDYTWHSTYQTYELFFFIITKKYKEAQYMIIRY